MRVEEDDEEVQEVVGCEDEDDEEEEANKEQESDRRLELDENIKSAFTKGEDEVEEKQGGEVMGIDKGEAKDKGFVC